LRSSAVEKILLISIANVINF
jgi:hypothetical protein